MSPHDRRSCQETFARLSEYIDDELELSPRKLLLVVPVLPGGETEVSDVASRPRDTLDRYRHDRFPALLEDHVRRVAETVDLGIDFNAREI